MRSGPARSRSTARCSRRARDVGAGPVGSRALMSLRVEKGYGSWSREYSPEYWPQEVGFDRLVKMDKGDFLNRDAYAAVADKPARDELIMLSIDGQGCRRHRRRADLPARWHADRPGDVGRLRLFCRASRWRSATSRPDRPRPVTRYRSPFSAGRTRRSSRAAAIRPGGPAAAGLKRGPSIFEPGRCPVLQATFENRI